ncbi:MAG: O-antigen ligase family protein [Burkholderiales bacterium]|nr:O-antigen ligase family protein [Burkholderiales bacterium]
MNTLSPLDARLQQHQLLAFLLFGVAILFSVLPTGLSWSYELSAEMVEGSVVRKLQWSSLFLIAGFLLWRIRFTYVKQFVWGNPFAWLLLVFAVLSVLWSYFPVVVVRQVIQFAGVLLMGMAVAIYVGTDVPRLVALCLDLLTAVLAASVVMVAVNPTIALETAVGIEGAWRGVLEQKNSLGIACGVSLLLWVYVQTHTPRHWLYALGVLGLIFLCLLKSRSSSSLFFGLLSVAVYLALYKQYVRTPLFLIRLMLFCLLGLLAFNLSFFFLNDRFASLSDILGPFSALFGKSSDLTGRGDIWVYVWQSIATHWWLGTGYASFWLGPGGPSQFIVDALRWDVPTAHNGYLEVLNELGLIGFGLFLLMMLYHIRNLLSVYRIDRRQFAFHSAILIIFVISNFSESTALRVTSFLQVLFFFSMMLVQFMTLTGREVNSTPFGEARI